jgi:hypothetical protein
MFTIARYASLVKGMPCRLPLEFTANILALLDRFLNGCPAARNSLTCIDSSEPGGDKYSS